MVVQNDRLTIRLSEKLKERFLETVNGMGLDYSAVIRNMIKQYIAKNRKDGD